MVAKEATKAAAMLLASLAAGVKAQAATRCWKPGDIWAPCGPGNDQCGPPVAEGIRPRFHVIDPACKMNDPNFPFYDEVHGIYHLMYQDHVIIPRPGAHGPDIGHVISGYIDGSGVNTTTTTTPTGNLTDDNTTTTTTSSELVCLHVANRRVRCDAHQCGERHGCWVEAIPKA